MSRLRSCVLALAFASLLAPAPAHASTHPGVAITVEGFTGPIRVGVPVTAQVRFTKTWISEGEGIPDREGKFTATVTFRFEPTKESTLDLVWQNPTGFLVTDYRITAETLTPSEN